MIRPLLEYGSIVWSPFHITKVNDLERVQQKLLKSLYQKRNQTYDGENYITMCQQFKLSTLAARRQTSDILFLHKILTQKFDSSELLQNINFNIPCRRSRHSTLFYPQNSRIDTLKFSPIIRCQNTYNQNACELNIDLFFDSMSKIKRSCYVCFH